MFCPMCGCHATHSLDYHSDEIKGAIMHNQIEDNEVMPSHQVPEFIDEFNEPINSMEYDDTFMVVDTKWWAYAIIVVGAVIAATFLSLIYLAVVRGVTSL
jgi:hypothetical protein